MRISVVIPVLDEEQRLAPLIEAIRGGGPCQVIVVDGGSRDGTVACAKRVADQVLHDAGGLARQLNRNGIALRRLPDDLDLRDLIAIQTQQRTRAMSGRIPGPPRDGDQNELYQQDDSEDSRKAALHDHVADAPRSTLAAMPAPCGSARARPRRRAGTSVTPPSSRIVAP